MNQAIPLVGDQHVETEVDFMELDTIIEDEFGNNKENLIMILQAIQRKYNYLPQPALTYLSTKIGIPYSKIYGVATFYSSFSLEPRGRNIITICLGTACHVRGGERVRERLQESLDISDGQTTEDQRFTLESVRCIGCCSLGPVIKVDDDVYSNVTVIKLNEILEKYE